MSKPRETSPAAADAPARKRRPSRQVGIYVVFDEFASPRLFGELGRFAAGKQRAQRLRELALTGMDFEVMTRPAHAATLPRNGSAPGGADGVFDDPID